ncbi:prolyl oligopeptidase family serine peptidase [Sphingomonas sp.]|jgi:prolyl oligopeptidase|uniref:prolyl oligopeptidase family serine peptidase n=1 Tax=Sphingomonas sp. TaxID=28214 RepID=UPI002E370DAF|nr:prolyl oligopeptidase family serine peptidase [Sphingomonas sp.]HEX4694889.1 prolyl oligopeptidase family serine peptidase [Sphingomonas sp.]
MRRSLALTLTVLAAPAFAQTSAPTSPMTSFSYPATERGTTIDEQFGVKVADPYRWLENDVRSDPKVAAWVADENKVTDAYLATLPGRDIFKARLTQLINYERFGTPFKKGGRYFYTRNSGLQNQAVLYVRDSVGGEGRVLIDPNGWSKDGATALGEWLPSEDGKRLVYTIQDGGTDWRTVKVLDVDTGKMLDDDVEWVKFSGLAWAKDGSGFYYSRFPEPAEGKKFQSTNENQAVYFHKLGTPQSADPLVYATPDQPKRGHGVQVTDDGKWLVITTTEGTDNRYEVTVIDLATPGAKPRTIFKGLENQWSLAGNVGSKFYWVTNKDAPRLRIVATDLSAPGDVALTEVVPQDKAVLDGAGIVGGKLIASYLVDVKSEVRRYALDGKPEGTVALPGIGSAGGFGGEADDPETFYSFTSYNTPSTIYRYDVATGKSSVWAQPKVAFDPANYVVSQIFYTSKDGTRVPMFIVRKKGTSGPAPTLLYAYGGFNISMEPAFSATRIAWLEQGGVYAVANIRGGGEYGKPWHDGGRLANKQNVFDDFIAAGEYLKGHGYTGKDQLAVMGGSNGGLLIGAVVNQRPDLFAAALPQVGVMDMLRFDRFTAGRYWVDDYGYPSKEADFRVLYKYSPYHNIRGGRAYPAILAATADTDDRVVPGHTFKYTAMLQSMDLGPKPHLVRIETRAGHGSGKPTDKIIDETASDWAFIAKWTGMTVKPVN